MDDVTGIIARGLITLSVLVRGAPSQTLCHGVRETDIDRVGTLIGTGKAIGSLRVVAEHEVSATEDRHLRRNVVSDGEASAPRGVGEVVVILAQVSKDSY